MCVYLYNYMLQGAITYPAPRSLHAAGSFTNQPPLMANVVPPVAAANLPNQANTSNPPQTKQRVFTGTITKLHENFGFIDGEIFFQMK
jgi:hypothetical protein